ncbi:MAG: SDR family oxidoreductase [Tunicatimonas sp.]
MKKILLAGATGVLGTEILKLLHPTNYRVRALVRHPEQQATVQPFCAEVFVGDATDREAIRGACQGIDIVLTTIGKSVSLFTNSAASFHDVDYQANLNLLHEAQAAGVSRFVYISIFGSETSPKLRVGWSQELFARQLMQSGLNHTIVKPVGFFSGLHDLIIMGKKGFVITPGDGKCLTNAIHQHDLAQVCVQCLEEGPPVMEVGGPEIHSRNEVAQLVAEHTGARRLNVPVWLVLLGLRVLQVFSKNLYDKLSYFTYITTHDMLAPSYGEQTFSAYLREKKLH